MKKLGKKLMALTMAGALACTPVTAFAAVRTEDDGTITGTSGDIATPGYTGDIDGGDSGIVGTVSTDVVKVVLPTADVDTSGDGTNDVLSTLTFTMDPQMLISEAAANESTVPGFSNVADDATILFANRDADGNVTGYSDTSDSITIINKGTIPVSVKLEPTATVTDNTDTPADGSPSATLAVADDEASFKSDGTPEICLSLNTGAATPTAIKDSNGTADSYTFELGEAPEGAYQTTYDADSDEFVYAPTDGFDESLFEKKEFTISGKANPDSTINWATVASDTAAITLAWTITEGTTYSGNKPEFASSSIGVIDVTDGDTDYVISSIESIDATYLGVTYDIMNDYSTDTTWTDGITFDAATLLSDAGGRISSIEATIEYKVTNATKPSSSKTLTSTVTLPLK